MLDARLCDRMARMPKLDRIPLNTTLDPVTYAALAFLAARESPGRCHANAPIARLVREELDRSHPGTWDRLVAASLEVPKGLAPKDQAAALASALPGAAPAYDGPACGIVFQPEGGGPALSCVRTMGHAGTCMFRPWKRGA